jgi:hypothetical protein
VRYISLMERREFWDLGDQSDDRILSELGKLLTNGARTEARVVAHLAEIDARKLTLLSAMSLFEYCVTGLKLSEHAAYLRISAARAARKFPLIFQLLERRALHLSAIVLLAKHLTLENHVEVLNEACGLTKRELLRAMAKRWPKDIILSNLRRLPIPLESMAAGPTGSVSQVQEFTHRLELYLSTKQYDKLELARDLMMHSNPTGDLSAIVERALDLLIAQQQRRQYGVKKASARKPAAEQPQRDSVRTELPTQPDERVANDEGARPSVRQAPREHIPNDIKRKVYERDDNRCTYTGPSGHRCESRKFLQIHHEQAWARNGPNTIDNLRLVCAAHNQLLAEKEFGQRKAHI